MSRYLKKIVQYFFHHDVGEEHRQQVYKRMVETDESELDEIFDDIWTAMPQDEVKVGGVAKRSRMRAFLRIAAMWVVPLCLTAVAAVLYMSSHARDGQPAMMQRYARIGTVERIVLPDSSEVWLNAGSVIMYPERYDGEERYVYIYGEGFFNVVRDESRPFTVKTDNMSVTVLGTSFNVNSFPGSVENSVTLETGKVSVTLPDNRNCVLSPDEHLVYNAVSDKVTVHKVAATSYSMWRNGELFLCDLPFEEALVRIGRAYGVKALVRNSKFNKERVHVRFNSGEPIENVMSILQHLVPGMKYEINDSTIVVE